MAMRGISGDAHFFEESMNWDRIRKLLDNKLGVAGHSEKLEAMKALLASISKGEDVSMFFADVVKNVIVASVEVKKLVYMYLVHYADANSQCRELALLSINSFQKDLADPNQLIRALALRVMTSIRVRDILQIQLIAIRKCTADASAYVRKCAANAISKIFAVDPEQQDVLAEIIGLLLNDSSTMVLGSAVQALVEVCPDRLDLLHRPFRKMCHLLADLDEWGQTVTINVLMRYCHEQFQSPQLAGVVHEKGAKAAAAAFPTRKVQRGFYSDDDNDNDDKTTDKSPFLLGASNTNKREALPAIGSVFRSDALASGIGGGEELDDDHRLLLRSSIPLLKSRNSGVVLAVATLHYYCGTRSVATSTLIGKSLVRILRSPRESQFVVLSVIASMATARAEMFRPFLPDFFVRATDAAYARTLKLTILTALATDDDSVAIILREFQAYVRHVDKQFVTATVRALGRVADAMPQVAERCLSGLMRLVKSSSESVVAESVVVIRQLLQQQTQNQTQTQNQKNRKQPTSTKSDRTRVVRSLAAMMVAGRVTSASARASIVWMLGEFRDDDSSTVCATETLRLLVKRFADESVDVRLQLLNLAVKLALQQSSTPSPTPQAAAIPLLLQYVLELCKFDSELDVRDRARLVRATLAGDSDIINPHRVFASSKPAPLIGGSDDAAATRFTLGTLSDVVRHSVPGYKPLPPWRTTAPDKALRDETAVATNERRGAESDTSDSRDRRGGRRSGRKSNAKANEHDVGFYSEDESRSDASGSGSDSESESDLSSESASNSSSASASDVSASESESESEDASDDASESDDSDAPRHRRHQQQQRSSNKQSTVKTKTKHQTPRNDLLLDPMGFLDASPAQHPPPPPSGFGASANNNLLGDLMGWSVTLPSTASTTQQTHELLAPTTDNGLSIRYSFLRQPSMYSPSMNLVQLWLSNASDALIRNVHIEKKPDAAIASHIVVSFAAIPLVQPHSSNAPTIVQLHVDFGGRLDAVELHIHTHDATFPVELAPRAGELLVPQSMSGDAFAARVAQTDASHIHMSDWHLPHASVDVAAVVQAVMTAANVAQVHEHVQTADAHTVRKCKFAGRVRRAGGSGGSGADDDSVVLIGVEWQQQTRNARLLVIAADDLFAERLAAAIQCSLPAM